jgi:hypothetical protein
MDQNTPKSKGYPLVFYHIQGFILGPFMVKVAQKGSHLPPKIGLLPYIRKAPVSCKEALSAQFLPDYFLLCSQKGPFLLPY